MARRSKATARLRWEVGQVFPLRDTASDGWIGDAAHRSRPSDHNPDANGIVHAEDFDEDNKVGDEVVGGVLWEFLQWAKDKRMSYSIYERQMFSSYAARGYKPWQVRPYHGSNKHLTHLHISVYGDDGRSWGFIEWMNEKGGGMTIADGAEIQDLQENLNWLRGNTEVSWRGLKEDGVFGDNTNEVLTVLRNMWGLRTSGRPTATDISKVERMIHERREHDKWK